jgi:signal recognition particle subunit SRP54
MSKMMKKFKGGGLKKMMRGMQGKMPPGMGGGGGFPGM